MFHESTA